MNFKIFALVSIVGAGSPKATKLWLTCHLLIGPEGAGL